MAISNASNQIVKVNLIPGIIPSVLHLSQYDTGAGRPITFSVYDGSQAFTIPSGVSIAFEGTKPDGNGFSFTCSKSGNNALLTNYTNQMTALSGKIMCQLVFTDTSGGRVGSLPVLMVVTPAGIDADTELSPSEIGYIVKPAELDKKINAPVINPNGTSGQLLRTLGNGETEWVDVGLPTDEQTADAVSDWLDEHPEATTTVEDGAVTMPKLSDDLQEKIKSGYYVNAMEHGAKGDGVTDDTAVLQNLLDNYVGVYLPKANPHYKVSQLKLHSRNHLLGCGQDSLIESYLNDDSSYIIITDDNAERPIIEKIRLIGNWHMSGINFKSTNLVVQTASKVIDCNIEKVINGIKFDQYQTECVVDRTVITGASQDGIIAPTSDCKFCNTTVGEIGRIGFNLKDSTHMQISGCKAYTCGKTTNDDTFGLGSDGYGVWINSYSVITNLTLEGMYRNGLFMRYGNAVSGLELNSFNYITHDETSTDIDSYAIVLENNNNHVAGAIIDGHYSYGDYLIGLTAQSTQNNVVDLVVRKETTAQHGTSHLSTSNVSLKDNTIIINGQTIEGEILEANLLRGGIELPSNANLNDYVSEYRNYYCSSGTVSGISNKPTSVGFTMKVSSALGAGVGRHQYIKQTVTEYLPPFKTYERLYNKNTQTFSEWIQVSGNYNAALQVVKSGVLNSSNPISFTVPNSSHIYLLVWGYITSCGVYVLTAGTTTAVNEVMKTDQYTTVTNNNGEYTVTCQSSTLRRYFIIGI